MLVIKLFSFLISLFSLIALSDAAWSIDRCKGEWTARLRYGFDCHDSDGKYVTPGPLPDTRFINDICQDIRCRTGVTDWNDCCSKVMRGFVGSYNAYKAHRAYSFKDIKTNNYYIFDAKKYQWPVVYAAKHPDHYDCREKRF